MREDLYDDEWSDEGDEVVPLETVQEDEEDEDDDDNVRYMLGSGVDEDEEGSDEEDEEEEEDVRGRRMELPPSRFGRRRWAPSRLSRN